MASAKSKRAYSVLVDDGRGYPALKFTLGKRNWCTIGRHAECDIVLDVEDVKTLHGLVSVQGGHLYIEGLDRNVPVEIPRKKNLRRPDRFQLANQETFIIGNRSFVVEIKDRTRRSKIILDDTVAGDTDVFGETLAAKLGYFPKHAGTPGNPRHSSLYVTDTDARIIPADKSELLFPVHRLQLCAQDVSVDFELDLQNDCHIDAPGTLKIGNKVHVIANMMTAALKDPHIQNFAEGNGHCSQDQQTKAIEHNPKHMIEALPALLHSSAENSGSDASDDTDLTKSSSEESRMPFGVGVGNEVSSTSPGKHPEALSAAKKIPVFRKLDKFARMSEGLPSTPLPPRIAMGGGRNGAVRAKKAYTPGPTNGQSRLHSSVRSFPNAPPTPSSVSRPPAFKSLPSKSPVPTQRRLGLPTPISKNPLAVSPISRVNIAHPGSTKRPHRRLSFSNRELEKGPHYSPAKAREPKMSALRNLNEEITKQRPIPHFSPPVGLALEKEKVDRVQGPAPTEKLNHLGDFYYPEGEIGTANPSANGAKETPNYENENSINRSVEKTSKGMEEEVKSDIDATPRRRSLLAPLADLAVWMRGQAMGRVGTPNCNSPSGQENPFIGSSESSEEKAGFLSAQKKTVADYEKVANVKCRRQSVDDVEQPRVMMTAARVSSSEVVDSKKEDILSKRARTSRRTLAEKYNTHGVIGRIPVAESKVSTEKVTVPTAKVMKSARQSYETNEEANRATHRTSVTQEQLAGESRLPVTRSSFSAMCMETSISAQSSSTEGTTPASGRKAQTTWKKTPFAKDAEAVETSNSQDPDTKALNVDIESPIQARTNSLVQDDVPPNNSSSSESEVESSSASRAESSSASGAKTPATSRSLALRGQYFRGSNRKLSNHRDIVVTFPRQKSSRLSSSRMSGSSDSYDAKFAVADGNQILTPERNRAIHYDDNDEQGEEETSDILDADGRGSSGVGGSELDVDITWAVSNSTEDDEESLSEGSVTKIPEVVVTPPGRSLFVGMVNAISERLSFGAAPTSQQKRGASDRHISNNSLLSAADKEREEYSSSFSSYESDSDSLHSSSAQEDPSCLVSEVVANSDISEPPGELLGGSGNNGTPRAEPNDFPQAVGNDPPENNEKASMPNETPPGDNDDAGVPGGDSGGGGEPTDPPDPPEGQLPHIHKEDECDCQDLEVEEEHEKLPMRNYSRLKPRMTTRSMMGQYISKRLSTNVDPNMPYQHLVENTFRLASGKGIQSQTDSNVIVECSPVHIPPVVEGMSVQKLRSQLRMNGLLQNGSATEMRERLAIHLAETAQKQLVLDSNGAGLRSAAGSYQRRDAMNRKTTTRENVDVPVRRKTVRGAAKDMRPSASSPPTRVNPTDTGTRKDMEHLPATDVGNANDSSSRMALQGRQPAVLQRHVPARRKTARGTAENDAHIAALPLGEHRPATANRAMVALNYPTLGDDKEILPTLNTQTPPEAHPIPNAGHRVKRKTGGTKAAKTLPRPGRITAQAAQPVPAASASVEPGPVANPSVAPNLGARRPATPHFPYAAGDYVKVTIKTMQNYASVFNVPHTRKRPLRRDMIAHLQRHGITPDGSRIPAQVQPLPSQSRAPPPGRNVRKIAATSRAIPPAAPTADDGASQPPLALDNAAAGRPPRAETRQPLTAPAAQVPRATKTSSRGRTRPPPGTRAAATPRTSAPQAQAEEETVAPVRRSKRPAQPSRRVIASDATDSVAPNTRARRRRAARADPAEGSS